MTDTEKQLPVTASSDSSASATLHDPRKLSTSMNYATDHKGVVEDNAPVGRLNARSFDGPIDPKDPGEAKIAKIRQGNGILRRLRWAETWFDRHFRFEAQGVERIPDDKRQPPQILNMMLFWFSLLFSPTMIPIGMLAPEFGLSVNTSVILTVCATITGSVWPAFTATLSPPTGLRQIAVSRYAFGVWGSKLCGFLNVIVNVGYAVISCVLGGQLVSAVSDETLPLALGIVLIALLGLGVSFLGFRIIHVYERYAWVLALIVFCIAFGQSAPYFSPTPDLSVVSGLDYTGACLTYFAIVFGVCTSWCPIAGDYYVHYPADVNPWLVFGLTWLGQSVPMIFVGLLGNYLGGAVQAHSDLSEVYEASGVGSLLLEVMQPIGWAKTACIIFFLSFLGNLVANLYSAALSVQLWGRHFIAVPRSLWCLLLTIIVLALALGGRNDLEKILNNLLSILGYWTLSFGAILLIEHFVFRSKLGGYDMEIWQDERRMPWGVAGTGTLLLCIGVSFLGMNQTWYMSPAAKAIGAYGGDVGDYIVFAASFIFYPIFRSIEIHLSGK